jgi:cell division protein FtsQ
MNTKLKVGLVIGLYILTMLAVVFVWLNSIREQRIQKSGQLKILIIKPSGENQLLEEKDVRQAVASFYKKDWRKIPIYALRTSDLERYLESQAVIHHAEVFIDSKKNLHVEMYQRDPLMRVADILGNQFYIDVEGKRIPNSRNYSARVPVVTGISHPFKGHDIWQKENVEYRTVYQLAKEIVKEPFIRSLVEQIDFLPSGELVLVPKIGNEKIHFGGIDNINEKLEKLKFFYQEGLRYEGWNVYQTIDLKNKDQVVCRKNSSEI